MFRDSYLKRIAKLDAATGNKLVRFRLRDGSIFSIPKRRVMDVYLSCFRGEVATRETQAVWQAVACSPGDGRMYELCQMMQE